jgi:uncharacterized membrane protein YqaE (UPF0057 family)
MKRLLALLCPPLAVLLCGGAIFTAALNLVFTLFFWVPGIIHAWGVVTDYERRKQTRAIVRATERAARETASAIRRHGRGSRG